MIIDFEQMKSELARVLADHGMRREHAEESAEMFTWNTIDGIASHGVNRFPRVIEYLKKGYIDIHAAPQKVKSLGAIEQWDGKLGMGNTNAKFCMNRAMELASEHGIGCVALANTNHWMRGGAYGWQAAERGYAAMCWTNTQPNMPPWGAKNRKIGNNPFIAAIPRSKGSVVVDMALAQYSYGKIEQAGMNGDMLPYPGGFDRDGNLTSDPHALSETWRVLPIGYWKGSGMSIALDLLTASLAGGNSVRAVGELGGDEYAVCQTFIAFDLDGLNGQSWVDTLVDHTVSDLKSAEKADADSEILYPGERALRTRQRNLKNGMEVNDTVWETIKKL